MDIFDRRLVWCHGPRPEYILDTDVWDKIYIPGRQLPLLRPQDIAIIPGGNATLDAFAGFCERILGCPGAVLRTSGESYLLDQDIERELLGRLAHTCAPATAWRLMPYSVTEDFTRWSRRLGAHAFGDTPEFVERFGHKGVLHPSIATTDAMGLLAAAVPQLRIPRGFVCVNAGELEEAWRRLACRVALVKPIQGATGEGIFAAKSSASFRNYGFPMGPVALEERLPAESSVSVQFNGARVFGQPTDQSVNGFVWEGNAGPADLALGTRAELDLAVQSLLAFLASQGLAGPGGCDFVIAGGKPYLVDVNLGRFTGAHIPKIFQERHAPGMLFQSWKADPQAPLEEFWERLCQRGDAFVPGEHRPGVFPLCYLPGMWSMLIALGRDAAELRRLRAAAEACFL